MIHVFGVHLGWDNMRQIKQKDVAIPFLKLTVKREISEHFWLLMNTLFVIKREVVDSIAAGDSILSVNYILWPLWLVNDVQ